MEWRKEPFKILLNEFENRDLRFAPKDETDYSNFDCWAQREGKSKKSNLHYCKFIDTTPRKEITRREFKGWGTDENEAQNDMAEKLLRFLISEGWNIPDVPKANYSIQRTDPWGEFLSLMKKKKDWTQNITEDRKGRDLFVCRITVEGHTIECLKQTFVGEDPQKKQAKRRACNKLLDVYETYRAQKTRIQQENKKVEKEVRPTVCEISTSYGVLNDRNKFIKIRNGDFAETESVFGEKPGISYLECLTKIAARESFSFYIKSLKRSEDTDDMETLDTTSDNIFESSLNICNIELKTKPVISVFGTGPDQPSAENNAAQNALYHLQIHCGDNHWDHL